MPELLEERRIRFAMLSQTGQRSYLLKVKEQQRTRCKTAPNNKSTGFVQKGLSWCFCLRKALGMKKKQTLKQSNMIEYEVKW